MFQWHRDMERLDLPAAEIFQLQRSLNHIQVALPGFPSQEAEAYLTLFAASQGVRAAVVLHLQTSRRLAIYLNEPGPVPSQRASRLLDEGIAFAESMGFMLGDLDFPLLDDSEKAALWDGLPLKAGLLAGTGEASPKPVIATPAVAPPPPQPEPPAARKAPPLREKPAPVEPPAKPAASLQPEAPPRGKPSAEPSPKPVAPAKPEPSSAAAVPPAAVPEPASEVPLPRTLRGKRRVATQEEIEAKRQQLRNALGKVLSSL